MTANHSTNYWIVSVLPGRFNHRWARSSRLAKDF